MKPPSKMSLFQLVAPLTTVKQEEPGFVRGIEMLGTCFSIGGGFYLTAGHVAKTAIERVLKKAIRFQDKPGQNSFLIEEFEVLPQADVAIFRAPHDWMLPMPWLPAESVLEPLEDVKTFGFPHAMSNHENSLHVRCYKGYVVATVTVPGAGTEGLVRDGGIAKGTVVYELSFISGRGISGAPLVSSDRKATVGVVVAIAQSAIGDEVLQHSIAVTSRAIFPLHSDLLGNTIGGHLKKLGLINCPRGSEVY